MRKRALIATRCFSSAEDADGTPLADLARRLVAAGWDVDIHAEAGVDAPGGAAMTLRRHGGPEFLRGWWMGRVIAAMLRADAAAGASRLVICDDLALLARLPSGAARRHRVLCVTRDARASLPARRAIAALGKADQIAALSDEAARRLRALAPDAEIAVAASGEALAQLCAGLLGERG